MGYTPHILVIGGGVLGTAIARDLALRGLEVTLLEQGTLTAGTTGRMQGILYSGARFAASNPSGAKRCYSENAVLRRIASHCIDDTGGYIAPTPGKEDGFDEYIEKIQACDISVKGVPESKLDELGADVERAVRVPDAAIDPFRLTVANAAGARKYGTEIKTGASVIDLHLEDDRITGVTVEYDPTPGTQPAPTSGVTIDKRDEKQATDETENADEQETEGAETEEADEEEDEETSESSEPEMPGEIQREFPGVSDDDEPERGETEEIEADYVINATGAWADRIAALAGIELPLTRKRGRMFVLDADPDVILTRYDSEQSRTISPFWGNAVLGPIDDGGDTNNAVDTVLDEMATILPAIEETTVLRSYSGVWTQHSRKEGSPDGPGATLVDHEEYGGHWGMLSVVGGTVTTHRLVAERAVDRVCSEFGIDRDCLTDEIKLPNVAGKRSLQETTSRLTERVKAANPLTSSSSTGDESNPMLCEAAEVNRNAVQKALAADDTRGADLSEVRIRTGATMGTCQGGRCGHRLAAELHPDHDIETVDESLESLLSSRWQGRRETLWGDQLATALDDYELHERVLNRESKPEEIDLDQFDDGTETRDRERPTMCEAVIR